MATVHRATDGIWTLRISITSQFQPADSPRLSMSLAKYNRGSQRQLEVRSCTRHVHKPKLEQGLRGSPAVPRARNRRRSDEFEYVARAQNPSDAAPSQAGFPRSPRTRVPRSVVCNPERTHGKLPDAGHRSRFGTSFFLRSTS